MVDPAEPLDTAGAVEHCLGQSSFAGIDMSQDPGNYTFFHNYFLCLQFSGQPVQLHPQPRFFLFVIAIIAAAKAMTISAMIIISIKFILTSRDQHYYQMHYARRYPRDEALPDYNADRPQYSELAFY